MYKNINAFRVSRFGGSSYWVCDDTDVNRAYLNSLGVHYSSNNFIAADGTRVQRLEWE